MAHDLVVNNKIPRAAPLGKNNCRRVRSPLRTVGESDALPQRVLHRNWAEAAVCSRRLASDGDWRGRRAAQG